MTNLELVLNMLGEASTTEIAKVKNAQGFNQNRDVAKRGGSVAGNARKKLETEIGKSVVSGDRYFDDVEKNISETSS